MSYNDYIYDGTFEGFLCLALRCFRVRSMPHNIRIDASIHMTPLRDYQRINTDFELADRFYAYIGKYTSSDVQQLLSDCFLTDMPDKEIHMVKLISYALHRGPGVVDDYSIDFIARINYAVCELYREMHKYVTGGRILFKDCKNLDIGIIEPHNYVIPLIRKSIVKRIELDDFMLYDKRHGILLSRIGEDDIVYDIKHVAANSSSDTYDFLRNKIITNLSAWSYCREPERGKELRRLWYIAG